MPSAASTAAAARGTSVRTTWIRARSRSIVATIVPIAITAALAASDSAGIDEPAKGMAASIDAPPNTAAAAGHTISAARSSGP